MLRSCKRSMRSAPPSATETESTARPQRRTGDWAIRNWSFDRAMATSLRYGAGFSGGKYNAFWFAPCRPTCPLERRLGSPSRRISRQGFHLYRESPPVISHPQKRVPSKLCSYADTNIQEPIQRGAPREDVCCFAAFPSIDRNPMSSSVTIDGLTAPTAASLEVANACGRFQTVQACDSPHRTNEARVVQ